MQWKLPHRLDRQQSGVLQHVIDGIDTEGTALAAQIPSNESVEWVFAAVLGT
ncbi:hypothetical protein [Cupriavidus lacunae]|uniref:hypothetical protein n=1 Tax=Cupriavidus lacunae TaxID=2666307 RepID=UPI00137499E1|nr:hypothetical protein [Cupriavidus lacunae]